MLNEIAPRPHNSGHYTIEACHTSQYENHLRAILGLPLGSTAMKVQASGMLNILGAGDKTYEACELAFSIPGTTTHLYGKKECKAGRKMGHITVVGDSMQEVHERLLPMVKAMDPQDSSPYNLDPLVSIVMGSDSDLKVMEAAAQILTKMSVPFELSLVSAHRTPERMYHFGRMADKRGVKVIIAGAGGAAHLPGMVAALTPLPVIGVPVRGSTLDGVDSLHSIVQMPVSVFALKTARLKKRVFVSSFFSNPSPYDFSPSFIARCPCRHRRHQQQHKRRPACSKDAGQLHSLVSGQDG